MPLLPDGSFAPASSRPRVLVVGGGAAGLVIARDLARAGVAVTILEASDRVGGQLASARVDGLEVDTAAESFATRNGTVAALAAELGLGEDLVRPLERPAWVIGAGGRAHPLPAASVLGIPGDPLAHDVASAIGRLRTWRAALDRLSPLRPPEAYRSLGDLVRRRMGAGVLTELVAPVVRGVYSTTPDELPLALASPGLPDALRANRSLGAAVLTLRAASAAGSQVAGLRGGVHRLATALAMDAAAHGARIILGARVTGVDATGVTLADGEVLEGRVVIAAASAAGPAPRTRAITVAVAVLDAPDLDAAPRGTGALITSGAPGITARALTHSSAKWAWVADSLPTGRHLVRLSYDELPDDPEATVAADLRAVTGARVGPIRDLHVRTWTRTLQAAPAPPGGIAVGEAAGTTGLAGIVAAARARAQRIIGEADSTDAKAARSGGTEG
ncbi:FAD-dependent oxidoreductase [uncultured Microbacterium sp.]|uniref:protoporphyrinogen/coproporphyrinogen oxidase n=1 Tax=uncultured Microbacterium sp. TaxID=191216 RepID=UPI0028D7B75E|nr:FAD-dependent oxidoreductase [uncultured Microbacterium sp.]